MYAHAQLTLWIRHSDGLYEYVINSSINFLLIFELKYIGYSVHVGAYKFEIGGISTALAVNPFFSDEEARTRV